MHKALSSILTTKAERGGTAHHGSASSTLEVKQKDAVSSMLVWATV